MLSGHLHSLSSVPVSVSHAALHHVTQGPRLFSCLSVHAHLCPAHGALLSSTCRLLGQSTGVFFPNRVYFHTRAGVVGKLWALKPDGLRSKPGFDSLRLYDFGQVTATESLSFRVKKMGQQYLSACRS